MDPSSVVDIGRQALYVTLLISGPLLVVGLIIGLMVGVFQAVTQIHEMTLTFIPKILGIVTVLILLMPWMVLQLIEYTYGLFDLIGRVGR
ncbi:Flagellar biosynthesis protein FliQ [Chitinispirillum alkaliphilum]|nr:Flagellar biosynthesis protein FliQ [Chitinispirillum alkaliphilum]